MKTLIVEDDHTSQLLLTEMLRGLGSIDVAANGLEALEAVRAALDAHAPYDLICLDIMMPEMDGQQALKEIRALEATRDFDCGRGAKILMTTALHDKDNVMQALSEQCDGYIMKPIEKNRLLGYLRQLGLIA
jgi:two-component system chemotaxis response regulator CheY